MGQTEKNSLRANVFRVTPDSGHCSTQSALRISFGLMRRSDLTDYSITSSARTRNDAGIQSDRLGSREINNELKLGRLLDGNIAGPYPAQNFVDQLGGAPVLIRE